MSIRLMASAMETALPASQKLVLMVLCDRANDQGGSIWESVGEIARKSSLSDRQVQRTMRHFEADLGLLRVVGNANGGAPGMSRRYRIDVARLGLLVDQARAALPVLNDGVSDDVSGQETGDMVSPVHTAETGDIVSGRVTSTTETGDMGVTLSTIDPSSNTNTPHTPVGGKSASSPAVAVGVELVADRQADGRPVERQGVCIGTWLARCAAEGVKPIPETDSVWRYAERCGIPDAFIGLAWAEFKRRRLQSGKRQRNWQQTFRNAVEGNWLKLWWADAQGTYGLTTQGVQARAQLKAEQAERAAQSQQGAAA